MLIGGALKKRIYFFFFKTDKGRIDLKAEDLELGFIFQMRPGCEASHCLYLSRHECRLVTKTFKCTSHFLQHIQELLCVTRPVNFSLGDVPQQRP